MVTRILAPLLLVADASAEGPVGAIKVRIIGLDAHAVTWTQIIQGTGAPPPIAELRIISSSVRVPKRGKRSAVAGIGSL